MCATKERSMGRRGAPSCCLGIKLGRVALEIRERTDGCSWPVNPQVRSSYSVSLLADVAFAGAFLTFSSPTHSHTHTNKGTGSWTLWRSDFRARQSSSWPESAQICVCVCGCLFLVFHTERCAEPCEPQNSKQRICAHHSTTLRFRAAARHRITPQERDKHQNTRHKTHRITRSDMSKNKRARTHLRRWFCARRWSSFLSVWPSRSTMSVASWQQDATSS